MDMPSPESLTALTVGFYLLATVVGLVGVVLRRAVLRRSGCWLALASFCCQTLVLVFGFHRLLPAGLSLGAYLQLLAWFFLLCGIAAWQRFHHDAILLFAAPLGLILFLVSAPWLKIAISLPQSLSAPFYALHIGALLLCLGLLALAFMAGLLFLFLEERIKTKKNVKGIWRDMPALAMLDKINGFVAIAAFPLYTTGIVAGLFWAKPIFGAVFSGDPKEVVSILIWLLLALLFYRRLVTGWCGRRPAVLTIVIFALSLFSFLAVNLLLSGHHGYVRS